MGEERKDAERTDRNGEPSTSGTASGVADDTGGISDEKVRPGSAIGGHEAGRKPSEERTEIEDERRGG